MGLSNSYYPYYPGTDERSQSLILLAEDDEDMRHLLALSLCREGYTVIDFGNGTDLMTYIDDHRLLGEGIDGVDLIITDNVMPGRSGLQVLQKIRTVDRTTPVILITSFGDEQVHAEATRLDAIILDKPFDIETLRKVVRTVMMGRP